MKVLLLLFAVLLSACSTTAMRLVTGTTDKPSDMVEVVFLREHTLVNGGADAILFEMVGSEFIPLARLGKGERFHAYFSPGCHLLGVSWWKGPLYSQFLRLELKLSTAPYLIFVQPLYLNGFLFSSPSSSSKDVVLTHYPELTVSSHAELTKSVSDWNLNALTALLDMNNTKESHCFPKTLNGSSL